jgi:hypothetical protein
MSEKNILQTLISKNLIPQVKVTELQKNLKISEKVENDFFEEITEAANSCEIIFNRFKNELNSKKLNVPKGLKWQLVFRTVRSVPQTLKERLKIEFKKTNQNVLLLGIDELKSRVEGIYGMRLHFFQSKILKQDKEGKMENIE